MKQPFLLLPIFISLFMCFSCEQLQQEMEQATNEESTETASTEEEAPTTTTEHTSSTPSANFMASMQNLKQLNTYVELSTKNTLEAMDRTAQTKTQYTPLVERVYQIQAITDAFHEYVNGIKKLIAEESDGVYTQYDYVAQENRDLIGLPKDSKNKRVIEQIFITGKYGGVNTQEQQGPVLFGRLEDLRPEYIATVENLLVQYRHQRDNF